MTVQVHNNTSMILDLAKCIIGKTCLDDMEDEVKVLKDRLKILENLIATEKPALELMRSEVEETFASDDVEITTPREINAVLFHNAYKAVREFESVQVDFNQKLLEITESGDVDKVIRTEIIKLLSEFSTIHDLWFSQNQDYDFSLFITYVPDLWCKIAVVHMDEFERMLRLRYNLAFERFFE